MIHVCFCLYDKSGRYSKFTGTTMLSLFDNHIPPPTRPSITVHILHDNTLSTDNRDKFIYVAGQYGQLVKFYNVEKICADKINEIIRLCPKAKTAYSSIASMYRLIIPQLLSEEIDKCIYLDSDIIVNFDIAELWRTELAEKPLAAVTEISNGIKAQTFFALCSEGFADSDDYFNAGVLLLNLKHLRNEEIAVMSGVKLVGERPELSFFDQDILNFCFSKQALKLPVKYNQFVGHARQKSIINVEKNIYHFVGGSLRLNTSDPFNRLWMDYFMKTPWFDATAIGRLYAGFQQIHVGLKQSMINVSAIMSGKTRAFFAPSANVDALKKIFSIRDDEEIIPAENNESLKKLIDAMNASRGKKVFFIMIPFPFQILTDAGFEPGKNFVNGLEFLSEAHGVPLNSYPLIKAM